MRAPSCVAARRAVTPPRAAVPVPADAGQSRAVLVDARPASAVPAPSRRSWPWPVAAAALALVVGAVGSLPGAQVLSGPSPAVALPAPAAQRALPPPAPDPVRARGGRAAGSAPAADLAALLQRRSDAVQRRDRGEWLATVDPAAGEFRAEQAALFDRLLLLPITRWSYQLPDPAGIAAGSVDVQLTYRLSGDPRDTTRQQQFALHRSAAGWLMSGASATGPADLWDLGSIAVARGSHSLVIGSASQRTALPRFAADADAAAARVDAVWGTGWPRTVVVEVPADPAGMASVLGATGTDGLDQVAAVTVGDVDATTGSGAGGADRIVVNAAAFAGFGPMGRRVVLTHEVTHVATRADSPVAPPLWLQEGFADYLAYRGTGLSRGVIAGDVLALVRAGRTPTHLPDEADFDPTRARIAPAYAGAWLALDLIARDGGVARVVAFYRAAAGIRRGGITGPGSASPALAAARRGPAVAGLTVSGPDLAMTETIAQSQTQQELRAAFSHVLAVDQATFVRRWRAYLVAVAQGSRAP